MSSLDKARETQLANIQSKTGKSLDELRGILKSSGFTKHGELRNFVMEKYHLGFGDAAMLVHFAQGTDGQTAAQESGASLEEILADMYSGAKSGLRPVHDAVWLMISGFGEYDPVPKKGYLSLRRKRQFAMVGPGTKGRLEIGINLKDVHGNERLIAQPPGGMCQYKVFLTTVDEVDGELSEWLRKAYEQAG